MSVFILIIKLSHVLTSRELWRSQNVLSPNCSLIIYIPPGEHIISYPVSIDSSIKIIGHSKNETSIRCGFTRSDLPNDTLHTIYFNKSSYVNLTNFSGIDCPLPFRLDTVLNVHVDSISIM